MKKRLLKSLVPPYFRIQIRSFSNYINNLFGSRESIFTRIYDKNLWGKSSDGSKYFSGDGTHSPDIVSYIEMLSKFIEDNKVKTVFEIGCGDFSIMESIIQNLDINYLGSDIVKGLVDIQNASYLGNEKINFVHMDAVSCLKLPDADLCIVRQVFQHLSNKDITKILEKTKNYKYIIITEHLALNPSKKNSDQQTGSTIRLHQQNPSGVFLDSSPFSLTLEKLLSYRSDSGKIAAVIETSLVKN